jgi:hypothetical protein
MKDDPFFSSIDWSRLYRREYTPPILDFTDLQDDDENDINDMGYDGGKVY